MGVGTSQKTTFVRGVSRVASPCFRVLSRALGLAFVAASGAARDEVPVPGDLGGQVGGELVKERRGKSIRSH